MSSQTYDLIEPYDQGIPTHSITIPFSNMQSRRQPIPVVPRPQRPRQSRPNNPANIAAALAGFEDLPIELRAGILRTHIPERLIFQILPGRSAASLPSGFVTFEQHARFAVDGEHGYSPLTAMGGSGTDADLDEWVAEDSTVAADDIHLEVCRAWVNTSFETHSGTHGTNYRNQPWDLRRVSRFWNQTYHEVAALSRVPVVIAAPGLPNFDTLTDAQQAVVASTRIMAFRCPIFNCFPLSTFLRNCPQLETLIMPAQWLCFKADPPWVPPTTSDTDLTDVDPSDTHSSNTDSSGSDYQPHPPTIWDGLAVQFGIQCEIPQAFQVLKDALRVFIPAPVQLDDNSATRNLRWIGEVIIEQASLYDNDHEDDDGPQVLRVTITRGVTAPADDIQIVSATMVPDGRQLGSNLFQMKAKDHQWRTRVQDAMVGPPTRTLDHAQRHVAAMLSGRDSRVQWMTDPQQIEASRRRDARRFTNWYNTHPNLADITDLKAPGKLEDGGFRTADL